MLEELRIEVNKACNFSCEHCYTIKKGPKSLALEHFENIISGSKKIGASSLSLTGGEPLADLKRTISLIKMGKDHGMSVRLNSNGWFLTKEISHSLKDAGLDELQISVNHHTQKNFDKFTNKLGAFERVVSGIKNSVSSKINTTVRLTLMIANSDELLPVYEMCKSFGVDKYKVKALVQGSGVYEDGWKEKDEVQDLLSKVFQLDKSVRSRPSKTVVEINDDGILLGNTTSLSILKRTSCKCGEKALFVSSDGLIFPCPFSRERRDSMLGNILETNVEKIYSSSSKLAEFIGHRKVDPNQGEDIWNCKINKVSKLKQISVSVI